MLIKALLFLWIGTSSQDHGLDSVTDILIMKPPWSAMANVSRIEAANQEGDPRRREPIEDPTKEELVIQDHPLGSQQHTGKSMLTVDQEPPVTKRSINPSGSVEGCQPCAGDRQQGRAGRAQVHQEDQDVSQAFKEVQRVRVEASKGVDEAKKVQEEDRSRQNRAGYWIIFGYSINAVLEPIGIAFLEDIFSGMEKAWKRFTAWVTNIEGYMGGYSWQHLFPELYGAGSSTLPCSSQDLDRILDAFEKDIPYIKTSAQVTLAIERLRSKIPVAISCILYDKNEYAEVVRVRQLIDDLVEAYFNLLQVKAASSSAVPTTPDFFFGEMASVYEKLPGLHQGATSKVEAFNAYKNSMTYIGSLLNHFGTAGKCAIGVLVTHDVFSERIANASSPEEARWEQIKMVISDVTLTGGCLAAGYSYATTLLNQMEPYTISCGNPAALQAVLREFSFMATPRDLFQRTGNMKAAKNYIKRFEQKMAVEFNCLYKEEGGVKFQAAVRLLSELARHSLDLFELRV